MQRTQRPILLAIACPATLVELRERATRAMSNGFDGVEWDLPDCFEQLQLAISDLDKMHIRALALRCEMMDVPSAVQSVSSQLHWASSLGTKVINCSIPPVRRGNDDEGFTHYQDALNFAYELLQGVRFDAEAAGVSIALEAANGGCLLSPIEVRELIDAANSSAIGVCLDVGRIGAIGSPLDWIDTLHRRVRAVRCTDVAGAGRSAAAVMSQIPLDVLTRALDGIPSDCPLILTNIAARGEFAETRFDG